MNSVRLGWMFVVAFVVTTNWCVAQTQPGKQSSSPPTKKAATPAQTKPPQWKAWLQESEEIARKGKFEQAIALADKAYKAAPTGENKAHAAFQLATLYEQRKDHNQARSWYLQAIYEAPKGPLAQEAKRKMSALPDSRRPAAAGATAIGGGGAGSPTGDKKK